MTLPAPPYDLNSPLEVVWMFSESCSLSFIFLSFRLFSVLPQLIFNSSSQFILLHLSSFEFVWKPSESCVLAYCIFVFLSFCRVLIKLQQFILVHCNSSGGLLSPVSCLFVFFLSFFCLFVFLSQLIFESLSLVHISSLDFFWKHSESCSLSFCQLYFFLVHLSSSQDAVSDLMHN